MKAISLSGEWLIGWPQDFFTTEGTEFTEKIKEKIAVLSVFQW
jgi:hypothetical protein